MKQKKKKLHSFFDTTLGFRGEVPYQNMGMRASIIENFSFILIIGVLTTVLVTVFGFFDSSGDESVVPSLLLALALLGNVILLRISQNAKLTASLAVLIIFVFFAYLVMSGFESSSLSFWFFQFIIFAFLLTGIRQGILWVVALVITFLLVMRLVNAGFLVTEYDFASIRSLFLTLGVSTSLIYLYERSIQGYIKRINSDEQNALSRNAQLSALIAGIGDGLITTDENGKVTFINQTAMDIIGVASLTDLENVIGENVDKVLPLMHIERKRSVSHLAILGSPHHEQINQKSSGDYISKRRSGEVFPLSITSSPILVAGKTSGSVKVFRDTTEQQALEHTKDEFISLASHQLRTPLTAMNWNIEILESGKTGKLTKQQTEIVDKIKASTGAMNELVLDLLDVSRLELKSVLFEKDQLDLSQLLQEVADLCDQTLQNKKIDFRVDIKAKSTPFLGDKKFIKAIFDNVLSNAIKYTPEKGKISVTLEQVQHGTAVGNKKVPSKGAVLTVTDTGCGIPANQQSKIFSKMFRADNTKSLEVSGTGLGLYITRLILDTIKGDIWFESKENKGSTFYVFIPTK